MDCFDVFALNVFVAVEAFLNVLADLLMTLVDRFCRWIERTGNHLTTGAMISMSSFGRKLLAH